MVRDFGGDTNVKSIINTRSQTGATIVNIMADYIDLIGETFPYADRSFSEIKEYLESIDGVYSLPSRNGDFLWFVNSENSQHITKMIQEQKPARVFPSYNRKLLVPKSNITQYERNDNVPKCKPIENRANHDKPDMCFYEDNYEYKQKRILQRTGKYRQPLTAPPRNTEEIAELYDHILVGDDFLMAVATAELGVNFTKCGRIRHCGFCVSGLTIRNAAKLIRNAQHLPKTRLIINVGSVDILHGRDSCVIHNDYKYLIETCLERNLKPIITTIAPIANRTHSEEIRQKTLMFNNYLLDAYALKFQIIDLYSVMVSARGHTLYDCYQQFPRYVTGSNQPHVLWNRIGRQRVLKLIKSRL